MPDIQITIRKGKTKKKPPPAQTPEVWPTMLPDDDPFFMKSRFDFFDLATEPLDLPATVTGNIITVQGEYTNNFWPNTMAEITYTTTPEGGGDPVEQTAMVYVDTPAGYPDGAKYAGEATLIPAKLEETPTEILPTTISNIRVWKDLSGWSGEIVEVASHHADLEEHAPYLGLSYGVDTICYSNEDSRVPAATIAAEFADTNDERWDRKPLGKLNEACRDNITDARWRPGYKDVFNFKIELMVDEETSKADSTADEALATEKKFTYDPNYAHERYLLKKTIPGKAGLKVTEIGSNTMGHYVLQERPDYYIVTRWAVDSLEEDRGIFFQPFNTLDTTNFKVTEEPSYEAEEVDGRIISLGKDYEIYNAPTRWAYYNRSRDMSASEDFYTVVVPVTCTYSCMGAMGPDAEGLHGSCWADATDRSGWKTPNDFSSPWRAPCLAGVWTIPNPDESDCIRYLSYALWEALMENTHIQKDLALIQWISNNIVGVGIDVEGIWDHWKELMGASIELASSSCTGLSGHCTTFYCYIYPCTAFTSVGCDPITDAEWLYPGCGYVCDCAPVHTSTHIWNYQVKKTNNLHKVGLWWDRWPNELAMTLVRGAVTVPILGVIPQDESLTEVREYLEDAGAGRHSIHYLSSIADTPENGTGWGAQYWYFDDSYDPPTEETKQLSGEKLHTFPDLKIFGHTYSNAVLKRIWQKIAGVVDDPNWEDAEDPDRETDDICADSWIPTVDSSAFWTNHNIPSFSRENLYSKWDNIPFGVGLSPSKAGELVGIIRRKDQEECYFVWRKTNETLSLQLRSIVPDAEDENAYEGHITSFESGNQENNGKADMFWEEKYDVGFVDQFYGTDTRIKTMMGRDFDTTISEDPDDPSKVQTCDEEYIYPYANPGCGLTSCSYTLDVPVIIMASKEWAIHSKPFTTAYPDAAQRSARWERATRPLPEEQDNSPDARNREYNYLDIPQTTTTTSTTTTTTT